MDFKLRVDGSWSDVSDAFLKSLTPYCEKLVLYEHPPEEGKGVHVHGLMIGWKKKEDTARNVLKGMRPEGAVKWSYELCQKQKRGGPPVDEGYIVYMSKGSIDPSYCKGWSDEYIAAQKAKWVDRVPIVAKSGNYTVTHTAKAKKPTSEEKMTAYLVSTGWRPGAQFSLAMLEELSDNSKLALDLLCNNTIRPAVIAYCYGRVHNQQLVAMVRNALYIFADENVRQVFEQTVGNSLTYV